MSFTQPDARILSEAPISRLPSFPKKSLTMTVAAMLGLFLAVIAALVREQFDRRIRSTEDILRYTTARPLALLPKIKVRKQSTLCIEDYPLEFPTSEFAEGIRAITLAVESGYTGGASRSVLVTSSVSGEGKTNIAICMARAAANAGLKTVIVDTNILNPSVKDRLGLTEAAGFGDLICGSLDIDEAIQKDEKTGLNVICEGSKNASEVMPRISRDKVIDLLDALVARFDLVIVDSAPVAEFSAARIIAAVVDETVFAIRWAHTSRKAVINCLRQLNEVGADAVGVVMSLVDTRRQTKFG